MGSPRRLDVRHARKVLAVVDQGLVAGVGVPEPGKLCVEAAVCLALGLPHGDDPDCVAAPDRRFKIGLNDAGWSSPAARAVGLRRIAVAQLGTRGLDRTAWTQRLVELTIRRVLPIALRAVGLEEAAVRCERDGDEAAALAAARAAARAAAWAARVASGAAAGAARATRATGAAGAAWAAWAAVEAAGAAWAAAEAAEAVRVAGVAGVARDTVLRLAADCGEQAYRDTGAPGIRLLDRVLKEEADRG